MIKLFLPKILVAVLMAASFVITPALSQAGEKGQQKKAEMMIKKEACKADKKGCKDHKMVNREASRPSLSEVPKVKKSHK
ncbi:MAG: hypothetical protein COB49_03570 [Alphaproteobacteria bacterium]|nr:MAG: hypothetical protein COB49_03570 [Alphaproteobacteria bacterium]